MHIRPEAYFSKENKSAASTDFVEGIEIQLGRELTSEEKIALNIPVEETFNEEDIDIIERA